MCDLSIIVPVYNAENYLSRIVGLLLTQKDVSFEIILVNDGSTDKSAVICDDLSAQDDRIRCLHIENGGPGRARNYGIDVAQGRYIAFCDSDDLPSENMYGTLYGYLCKNDVDYCMCDFFSERDGRAFGFPWSGNQRFEGQEVIKNLLASMVGNQNDDESEVPVWGSSCRAIYKKELIDKHNVRFPEDIRFAEDLVFNVRYLEYCRSAYVLDEVLYRYVWNKDSLMNSFVRYRENMLQERLTLVHYLYDAVALGEQEGDLHNRLATSSRCYFHECVGNAARAVPKKGVMYAYKEIKTILHTPEVCKAFKRFEVLNSKKRLLYSLIQRKCTFLLTAYYTIRLQWLRR